ncbi:helix-turn-helix domain-containing protein [Rhodococcus koreensis]|uniref:DNA-binding transcriptional regulator, XRE-family HTH domain n=1 Tax=Rhodococcus koreensis TaxID=99653 RepID=A0A1H4ZQU6_9NOCA|nr:helix-turn-helix transcriptional regulator [Rhodococcus koreensis]SED32472.1 DNA-binding transcriptional regulator, XRE-family HTH domain [Rhodococcus koreensis]
MTSQGEAFGPWLGRQLRRTGKSQAQLAGDLGITRAAVSAWITNRSEPRDEMKTKIAAVLGTDASSVASRTTDVDAELPLRWHHRPAHADGGREYGNAAAFAFQADLSVLAREATQNSLDERFDATSPVRVDYTLHELTGKHLTSFLAAIQWGELEAHLTSAASAEQKVSRSLRAALDDLEEQQTLLLLRIEDYNASGLTGPEYSDGRFAAVVRRQLDSHKQSGLRSGGSYGLGKATLWATSRFGLVLMNSTLSTPHEGRTERRLVGRLDLPWHEVDGTPFAGPAWFGEPDTEPDHRGTSRSWWADEETVRRLGLDRISTEPGTSFLIVGAHDASGDAGTLEEMHDKLVRSLADGFWAAMVGGLTAGPLMQASVTTLRDDKVVVAKETVDPNSHHPALSRAMRAYLDNATVNELTAADQVAIAEVPLVVTPLKGQGRRKGKGVLHNSILLITPAAESAESTNRVTFMRGNRMTIVEHRPREIPLGTPPFQAVLLAGYATGRDDDDVTVAEAFLRASEPPEHDRWDRTEELTSSYEKGAITRLREFRAEIDKAVRGLVGEREVERGGGPKALRELLRLDAPHPSFIRKSLGAPTVRGVTGQIDHTGAWHVAVTLKVPESDSERLLTPVAKFDVRSGGRPTIRWQELDASEGCRIEGGSLAIEAGVRSATFVGVTDPSTHPVHGRHARLVVEVQAARGGAS